MPWYTGFGLGLGLGLACSGLGLGLKVCGLVNIPGICIGQNIKSRKRPSVRPSGVRGQKCDIIHGPIFTKFGT